MAVQAVDVKSGEKTEVPDHTAHDTSVQTTNNAPVQTTQNKAVNITKSALGVAEQYGTQAVKRSRSFIDSLISPERRAELLEKVQAFVFRSPKLAAFIGLNLVLTGTPLILFVLFAISTFVVSLVVALVVAILAAVTFTLFAVGGALLVVLPVVLLTTFAACSIFIWGLTIFLIYRVVKDYTSNQSRELETKGKKA